MDIMKDDRKTLAPANTDDIAIRPTIELRLEHETILQTLESFAEAVDLWIQNDEIVSADCERFLDFFLDFGDQNHHQKEEQVLFPQLAEHPNPAAGEFVAVLESEHDVGRTYAGRLQSALQSEDPLDSRAFRQVIDNARLFIAFLREHIEKEERCLFSLADALIEGNGRVDEHDGPEPIWQSYFHQLLPHPSLELAGCVTRALTSTPVESQRRLFEKSGLTISKDPLMWKRLPDRKLRLFFEVRGKSDAIDAGGVVALVLLYDLKEDRALYAHPVHAGPSTNPLLKHFEHPMAQPKAQVGANGDRATLRILEHKKAIWNQFLNDKECLGPEEAGRRWRQRYAWSLVRLYFCARCPACRFGSPEFDGPDGTRWHDAEPAPNDTKPHFVPAELEERRNQLVDLVRASDEWKVETAYVGRGGFHILSDPVLVAGPAPGKVVAFFPSDVQVLNRGTIVGLAAHVDEVEQRVSYIHILCAGEEEEVQFMLGDRGLGLVAPQPGERGVEARSAYSTWRRSAWSTFWLNELELGLRPASCRWLSEYWKAISRLFGETR